MSKTPPDFEGVLTEVGVDGSTANPKVAVGASSILRSEQSVEMFAERRTHRPEVSLDSKIGEGETTETWLGTQRSMRRKIAVQKVHPARRTPNAPGYLLSEAWMRGAVEHPHVLPIYGVTKDADGLPLVMRKAIETVPWSDVLAQAGHPLGCPEHLEPVEFNVRRMLKVVEALENAHYRGIIHRDVKPANILIGRDGTVYLDGWDLAVARTEDAAGRFPRAIDQTEIAGTPSYMAPEQANRDPRSLGPATDVYLVGATLHEVITGHVRHEGENVFDAFYSASASSPVDYDPDIAPRELAAILNKAMDAVPSRRFQTMTELRHALESFLRHRPSDKLASHALIAHQEFSNAVEKGDDFAIRELFGSAYMAYQSARHFWARNPLVVDGLERLTREMIEVELELNHASRAQDLAERLVVPDPELSARIHAIASEPETIVRRQPPSEPTADARALEPPEVSRTRLLFMVAMVGIWSAFGFVFAAFETLAGVAVNKLMLGTTSVVCWFVLILFVVLKQELRDLASSRVVLAPMAVVMLGSFALIIGIGPFVTPHVLVAAHLFLFFLAMAMLSFWFKPVLGLSALAYFLGFVVSAQRPETALWMMGVTNLVGLGSSGYLIHRHLSGGRA